MTNNTTAERQKIRLLREIADYDYTFSLRQARSIHCEGTCVWILSRTEFKDWADQRDTRHLCCYGIRKLLSTVLSNM